MVWVCVEEERCYKKVINRNLQVHCGMLQDSLRSGGSFWWPAVSPPCVYIRGGLRWGEVKVLHIAQKVASDVHSHPPRHYICKHAPG